MTVAHCGRRKRLFLSLAFGGEYTTNTQQIGKCRIKSFFSRAQTLSRSICFHGYLSWYRSLMRMPPPSSQQWITDHHCEFRKRALSRCPLCSKFAAFRASQVSRRTLSAAIHPTIVHSSVCPNCDTMHTHDRPSTSALVNLLLRAEAALCKLGASSVRYMPCFFAQHFRLTFFIVDPVMWVEVGNVARPAARLFLFQAGPSKEATKFVVW